MSTPPGLFSSSLENSFRPVASAISSLILDPTHSNQPAGAGSSTTTPATENNAFSKDAPVINEWEIANQTLTAENQKLREEVQILTTRNKKLEEDMRGLELRAMQESINTARYQKTAGYQAGSEKASDPAHWSKIAGQRIKRVNQLETLLNSLGIIVPPENR